MERLKAMKDQMMAAVQTQMGQLEKVNAKELGEAVDIIKDLAMTMYYCSIVKAMEEDSEKEEPMRSYYYTEKYLPYPTEDHRDWDYYNGRRMYYGDSSVSPNHSSSSGSQAYYEESYPMAMRDSREGRSGQSRKMYMESKETHQDQAKKIQELENYMKELTTDITDMIADASPEEKSVLQRKLNTLVNKIQNV